MNCCINELDWGTPIVFESTIGKNNSNFSSQRWIAAEMNFSMEAPLMISVKFITFLEPTYCALGFFHILFQTYQAYLLPAVLENFAVFVFRDSQKWWVSRLFRALSSGWMWTPIWAFMFNISILKAPTSTNKIGIFKLTIKEHFKNDFPVDARYIFVSGPTKASSSSRDIQWPKTECFNNFKRPGAQLYTACVKWTYFVAPRFRRINISLNYTVILTRTPSRLFSIWEYQVQVFVIW